MAGPKVVECSQVKVIRNLSPGYFVYMGVSKNRGTPKWMVKIMENPIKMDDLGGPPLFLEGHPYHHISSPISMSLSSTADFKGLSSRSRRNASFSKRMLRERKRNPRSWRFDMQRGGGSIFATSVVCMSTYIRTYIRIFFLGGGFVPQPSF